MPNIESAKKRMKTAAKNRMANKACKTRVATARKKLHEVIVSGDEAAGKAAFSAYCSALDKAVKRGAMVANTASRGKSRAAARLPKKQVA